MSVSEHFVLSDKELVTLISLTGVKVYNNQYTKRRSKEIKDLHVKLLKEYNERNLDEVEDGILVPKQDVGY